MSKPYKCPVCGGRGIVPAEFYYGWNDYSTTAIRIGDVSCRSCGGTGLVWQPEPQELTVIDGEIFINIDGE